MANGKAITDENIREIIYGLKSEYPEGMRWNNDNYYLSEALRRGGHGCDGFGLICSDAAFGDLPISSTHSDFAEVKVGDLLRINNDTHTVIVLEKNRTQLLLRKGIIIILSTGDGR